MGRFYQTARPKFIDHIYQPDQNLQLAEAKAEIEEDALMKSFASNSELGIKPTFKAWQGDMDNEVQNLNKEIEPLVQELMTEGTNAKTIRKLNDLKRKAQKSYSSGSIGKMSREYEGFNKTYEEKLEAAKKIKEDDKRQAELSRLETWRGYVGQQASKGDKAYDDFRYSSYSNFMDPTGYLEEHLTGDNLKNSQTYLKKQAAPVVDGKILTEEERKEMGVVFSGGKYFLPDGDGYKDITVGVGDPVWKKIFPFQYQATQIKKEGYDTDLISKISQSMLYNNQAVFDMYAQDHRDFGRKKYFDPSTGTMRTAKDAEEYASGMIRNKANEYAQRFTGTLEEKTVQNLTNKSAFEAYKQNLAYNIRQKGQPNLVTQTLNSSSRLELTHEGIKALQQFETEKHNYMEGVMNKIVTYNNLGYESEQIISDLKLKGMTPQKIYQSLPESEKIKIREESYQKIADTPSSSLYKDVERLENKYIDLSTHGTVEFRELLKDLPRETQQKTMDNIKDELDSEYVKQTVRQAPGYIEIEDNVYFGSKNGGPATKVSDNELIGQTISQPGTEYDGYVVVAIDPENKMMVTPMDSQRIGGQLTMGSATVTQLVLMEDSAYKSYKENLGITDVDTQTNYAFSPEGLKDLQKIPKFKDKMIYKNVTKYVDDQKFKININ